MRINVDRLARDGETFEGEDPVEILEWPAEGELFYPVEPVRYRFFAKRVGHAELLVTGSVSTRFAGACTRCGGPLDLEVRDDDFCQSFPLSGPNPEVDLTEEERVSIILALPDHPVCDPDCAGVCPHCGKRRAEGPCGCVEEAHPAWEALDSVVVREEPEP